MSTLATGTGGRGANSGPASEAPRSPARRTNTTPARRCHLGITQPSLQPEFTHTPREATAPVEAPPPLCPRCGYDQSGIVATWATADSCPLRGICTECGLEFDWSRLLRAHRLVLPWFFEHAGMLGSGSVGAASTAAGETPSAWRTGWVARAWGAARTASFTWVMALWPLGFWRRVQLEHPVRPWRAAAWVVLLAIALHALCVLASLSEVWAFVHQWNTRTQGPVPNVKYEIITAFMEPFAQIWGPLGSPTWAFPILGMPYPVSASLATMPLVPIVLLILSHTRATAKVRAVHIVRAGIYQVAILFPFWVLFLADRVYASLQAWGYIALPAWRPRGFLFVAITPWVHVLGSIVGVWYLWYWFEVICRGLRLPRPWLVWVLMMISATLLGMIVALRDPAFWRLLWM